MEIEKNLPIGFMDSCLGGLSVLKEALRVMETLPMHLMVPKSRSRSENLRFM